MHANLNWLQMGDKFEEMSHSSKKETIWGVFVPS